MAQPAKGLEYKIILSHVTDFEDWILSGSGDDYEEKLRVPFQNKQASGGINDPHASLFGAYKVRDPVTDTIVTRSNHDDFGLLNQPYHYQDKIHPYIFDKKARGGSAQRDLEFELDVSSITHTWSGLGSALNMPARDPFSRGDDNSDSVTNVDVGGMVYQLNTLAIDLGSQAETITVQGVCIDRENPPHQTSPGAPHIRKQQLLDIARGQWAGSSGYKFKSDDVKEKDFMTPAYWLALTIGPVQDRTLQSGVFSLLRTSLIPVSVVQEIPVGGADLTTIYLSDNTGLTVGDIIKIQHEQFKIEALTTTTATLVTRRQNGTTKDLHPTFTNSRYSVVRVYAYTENYWTGDEPSDDIRGKERLRNEYRPGFVSPNTEQSQTTSGTDYRVLSSGYQSVAQSSAIPHPEIKERKAATYEHNRDPAETEFWRDGWRRKEGGWWFNNGAQANNPLLRDWDYKFHYDGRSRYRGAIKNLTFTQQAGRPDTWEFNFTFMVIKNETRIRHLSTADDQDSGG